MSRNYQLVVIAYVAQKCVNYRDTGVSKKVMYIMYISMKKMNNCGCNRITPSLIRIHGINPLPHDDDPLNEYHASHKQNIQTKTQPENFAKH